MTSPELCQTQIRYDANHQLTAYIDPEDNRTSYTYDAVNSWVESIQTPDGYRTTYTWDDWATTVITDPKGNTTTLNYNWERNIQELIDPLGHRTTYLWEASRLQALVDGRGYRTTLSYKTLGNRTKQLQAMEYPDQGRFTFL